MDENYSQNFVIKYGFIDDLTREKKRHEYDDKNCYKSNNLRDEKKKCLNVNDNDIIRICI